MATRTFTKHELLDEIDALGVAVHNQIIDTTRWENVYTLVFPHEGKYYQTTYSRGATEMQDYGPWEYDNEIECIEVHEVEKLVKVWEPVE